MTHKLEIKELASQLAEMINPTCVKNSLFQGIKDNTMAADALASVVTRSSTARLLTLRNEYVIAFLSEEFWTTSSIDQF